MEMTEEERKQLHEDDLADVDYMDREDRREQLEDAMAFFYEGERWQ